MPSQLKFVESVWHDMLSRGGVEKSLIPGSKILSAQNDFVTAEIDVEPQHLNRLGFMQGGVVSTLIDIGGSLALATRGMFLSGVTTDLSTTYISAVGRVGDKLRLDCFSDKMGQSMAFTFVEIRRSSGGEYKLVARGNHSKYIAHSLKSDRNVDMHTWEDDAKPKL